MGTPHKHAAVIKAWADGAIIECRDPNAVKPHWHTTHPLWYSTMEYRVKKEPQIVTTYLYRYHDRFISGSTAPLATGYLPGHEGCWKCVATYTYEVPENDE